MDFLFFSQMWVSLCVYVWKICERDIELQLFSLCIRCSEGLWEMRLKSQSQLQTKRPFESFSTDPSLSLRTTDRCVLWTIGMWRFWFQTCFVSVVLGFIILWLVVVYAFELIINSFWLILLAQRKVLLLRCCFHSLVRLISIKYQISLNLV